MLPVATTDEHFLIASGHGRTGARTPRVLIVVQDTRLLRTVMRVMNALGADSMVVESIFSVRDLLTAGREVDLLVYDFAMDADNATARDALLTEMSESAESPAWVLLSERNDTARLMELFNLPYKGSVVAKIGEIVSDDLLVSASKLLARDIFGADKYLRWGSMVHQYAVRESAEKKPCLDELEAYLWELSLSNRVRSRLITVADEFLMNALYDAPTDDRGQHVLAGRSRRESVSVTDDKTIAFEFGSDGHYVSIGCRDPFGSLKPERVLASLERCLRRGDDQLHHGPGGAGIGLYLIYQFVDLLVVNIQADTATEFLGFVRLNPPPRKIDQGKTLNIFNLPVPRA
jgi:hypothetical protein